MTDIDLATLPRVGGTGAGGFYALGPDLLLAAPHDGYVQTVDAARASLQELYRICRDRGRKHVVVVMVDRVRSQDSGSRRVWSSQADPGILCGLALVTRGALARAVGSFFMGLTRPRMPTVMVSDIDQAIEWSRGILAQHGGPVDG